MTFKQLTRKYPDHQIIMIGSGRHFYAFPIVKKPMSFCLTEEEYRLYARSSADELDRQLKQAGAAGV
jgi:hypothetical protein